MKASNLNIAFVNPPFIENYSRGQRSPAVTKSGTLYYPMWLAYAACYAEKLGHKIFLLDAIGRNVLHADAMHMIVDFEPDLIFVEVSTPSSDNDIQFALDLQKTSETSKVFLCGSHVSALPAEAYNACKGKLGIIIGEYEIPMEEVIGAILSKSSFENLEGVFTGGNVQPRTKYLEELDFVPFVSEIYKRFLPIDRYFNPNAHHPMIAIYTGRGCPYRCSYCLFPQTLTGHVYRKRSVKSVIDEFKWIAKNLPDVRGVFIEDDTFTADSVRVKDFCEQLEALNLPLSWTTNSRADVDRDTLIAMKKSGLRALCVGFESGSQKLLNNVGKGTTIPRMKQFAKDTRELGVKIHGCFMLGLPGETKSTMKETLRLALEMPLDTAQFYPLMVYPGTKAYDWAKKNDMIVADSFRNWLSEDGMHKCVIRTSDCSSDEIVQFCNFARRRFYLRKSYIKETLVRIIKDKDERNRVVKSAKTFFYHLVFDK